MKPAAGARCSGGAARDKESCCSKKSTEENEKDLEEVDRASDYTSPWSDR